MSSTDSSDVVMRYYRDHYSSVHTRGALGLAAGVFHRRLERPRTRKTFDVTLELGAGNLEHLPFVRHGWRRYVALDVRPVSRDLAEEQLARHPGLELLQADALQIPLADKSVDRIVATCLLVHLPDPAAAVREWQRVCKPDGVIDLLVPCDPGVAARTFRRLVSEPAAARQGVSRELYRTVNALEHVTGYPRALELTRAALQPGRRLRVQHFPFPGLSSWNLNAFSIFRIGPAA